MKILQICPKPPMPLIDGGCIASHALSQNLLSLTDQLKVVAFTTPKHPYSSLDFDPNYHRKVAFESVFINTLNYFKIARHFFTQTTSVQCARFKDDKFSQFLNHLLTKENYDVIVFDGLMTAVYLEEIKNQTKAKLVYRAHNIEYLILEERHQYERNPIKKHFFKNEAKRLKSFEEGVWGQVDLNLPISNQDLTLIKPFGKCAYLPFSIDPQPNDSQGTSNTLFHIGAMDWKPNSEGIQWFLKEVWPSVLSKFPTAEIHLAGKEIQKVNHLNEVKNCYVHKDIQSSKKFMDQFEIMIVPLFSGSGVRIKVLEGMARGKCILSTSKGVEGLELNGDEVLVADSPRSMSEQIIEMLSRKLDKKKIGKLALEYIGKNHAYKSVNERLFKLIQSLDLKSK